MELSYGKHEGKTWIYTCKAFAQNWSRTCSKSKREFSSVVLRQGVSEQIMDDVSHFLKSESWYKSCGVPYRRGYLLYGPPGSGKTSFILALAGQLDLSLCILNLSNSGMTDERLVNLFTSAPPKSIILLEDVDSSFSQRDAKNVADGLTFSGLLNALDGVASHEGRIVFMTTNHIEKLAPALIRPGRVDARWHFELASAFQIEGMFKKFFPGHEDAAVEISRRIPEETVSTAQLQGYFMRHRDNPTATLDDVDAFLEECEEAGRQSAVAEAVQNDADNNKDATEEDDGKAPEAAVSVATNATTNGAAGLSKKHPPAAAGIRSRRGTRRRGPDIMYHSRSVSPV